MVRGDRFTTGSETANGMPTAVFQMSYKEAPCLGTASAEMPVLVLGYLCGLGAGGLQFDNVT